ncbi:aminotransferase DegT [Lachnospiraceae bacterium WCA-9-b2]|uniref:Aminotransferase DegT n=1 Tax=Sporofaciens musculi TaxID=2681861 RepID=A0A7X3SHV5_9FIRM|nr:DegT/DnrJ/EryC1/StrS family aminotransferase [Sporofaciens musculi]MXP74772.1 aminotransferase DegT [Sporofaciens musculi]
MYITKKHRFEKFLDKVWLSSPTMHGDELKYITEAYETNWMSTVGENINEVEREIAKKVGCGYAVALSVGTAALHLAAKLAGMKVYGHPKPGHGCLEGKKVFSSDMTFCATINPLVYEGAEPIFIDSEYDTWNMDPVALKKAFEIYPDVKIVVVAHLYGTPGKIDEIREICKTYKALIIEDAAESLGATYKGKETGTFGDYNCISFNGNKIICGSSGGCFLTDSKEDADKVRKWSTQARERASWYQHEEIGYNYRMSNVIAGVVRGQIPYLEKHIAQKRIIYERYKEGLKNLPISMNPFDAENSVPNYWLSCIIIDEDAMCRQVRGESETLFNPEHGKSCPTEILNAINSINAEGRPIWKPMHMQPIYIVNGYVTREGNGRARTDMYISGSTVSEDGKPFDIGMDIFHRGLCLPSDNKMTAEQQDRIIEVINACFE